MAEEPTVASILAAVERIQAYTVHIFCHPGDADRVMAVCGLLAWPYKVTPSALVPAGRLFIYDPEGRTRS